MTLKSPNSIFTLFLEKPLNAIASLRIFRAVIRALQSERDEIALRGLWLHLAILIKISMYIRVPIVHIYS